MKPTKNAFASAQAVPVPAAKAKKEKIKAKIIGLEDFAALDAIINSLTTLRSTAEENVKDGMTQYFVANGTKTGKRPENFEGYEGIATASCELRKRSSRSGLTDWDVATLTENGIPFTEESDRTETYVINPQYLDDSALLEKVGKAIAKVPGVPDDFIQFQAATKKRVTTDETLNVVFTLKDADKISMLLKICGTLAIKSKVSDTTTALEIVRAMITLM